MSFKIPFGYIKVKDNCMSKSIRESLMKILECSKQMPIDSVVQADFKQGDYIYSIRITCSEFKHKLLLHASLIKVDQHGVHWGDCEKDLTEKKDIRFLIFMVDLEVV